MFLLTSGLLPVEPGLLIRDKDSTPPPINVDSV